MARIAIELGGNGWEDDCPDVARGDYARAVREECRARWPGESVLVTWGDGNRAIDAMSLCAPNGRDYYVQGADALKWATKFHVERVQKLVSVRDELMRLSEYIADAP